MIKQVIYPDIVAIKKQTRMINGIFLIAFLFLRSIIIPKPELTNNPESNAPKDNEPLINNSVINKDEAQLGINPIIEVNNGVKYLFD